MNKIKVSIVLPCFNVADYVDRSYLSCVAQNFENIEIIFVNDASEDGTLEKLNEIEKNDKRVKIINLYENLGTFHARKVGFENSIGDFIFFLDPDDEIDENFIKEMVSSAIKNDSDFVFCRIKFLPESIFDKSIYLPGNSKGFDIFTSCIDKADVIPKGNGAKIYRRSLVNYVYKQLSFIKDRFIYAEDAVFFFSSLLNSNSISSVDKYLYFYHRNINSVTMSNSIEKIEFNVNQLAYAINNINELLSFSQNDKIVKSAKILIDNLNYDYLILKKKISIIKKDNLNYFSQSLSILKYKLFFRDFIKLVLFLISFTILKY